MVVTKLSENLFLNGRFCPKMQNLELKTAILDIFTDKIEMFSTMISSVENLQLFALPSFFLTHNSAAANSDHCPVMSSALGPYLAFGVRIANILSVVDEPPSFLSLV